MKNERTTTTLKVNDAWYTTQAPYGSPILDFLRGELELKGTKEGCREGDCGACAVLVGRPLRGQENGTGPRVRYRAVPSCLLALGDVDGCHVITIEGLTAGASDGLTPVMRAFLEENASQCGFCTPGFIIALSSWLAEPVAPNMAGAMVAIDGNLCRCTGYGSIRRAAERLVKEFADLPLAEEERLKVLVERQVLPKSVLAFLEESEGRGLKAAVATTRTAAVDAKNADGSVVIGGGTDYYVRNPAPDEDFAPALLAKRPELAAIREVREGGRGWVEIGAAATVHDFFASPLVRRAIPGIENFETEFASTLIRNLATVGGNIANASPVGDLTSMLLGAGAVLVIGVAGTNSTRTVPLEKFFLGYKKIDLTGSEVILAVRVPEAEPEGKPEAEHESPLYFSFEKIAKRKRLDIASVNTAMSFRVVDGKFRGVRLSAGGIAPTPALLTKTAQFIEGQEFTHDAAHLAALARKTADAAMAEIAPISDVRGTDGYRRAMLGRLILAHFLKFFENDGIGKVLFP
ncbi:MAG TPA: FAD binding domain-containing protein [Spirochaetales bacterium]|nr:FAD binding domain-containing protein [Spirochaetales bacterium]